MALAWCQIVSYILFGAFFTLLMIDASKDYQAKQSQAESKATQSVDMTHFCMDLNGNPALSDKKGYAWNLTYDSGIGTLEARLDVNGHAMRCMTREEFLAFFGSEESVLKLIDELNFYRWENE
ncbi:hypothetical protein Vc3S01_p40068 (plasmid) [Vibrio campbellii]|nr:hypothetical protein Vc3S01_p40068 [Vibrio campbellii]